MNKYLIVNADDFGYSYGVNKGIIEAHTNGIVTSTSVMVDAIAAHEAEDLVQFTNLSVGLHFEVNELVNVEAELKWQIDKFVEIVGRSPDHIDTHKRHTTDEGVKEVLIHYTKTHRVPVRNFNAKHIRSFGIHSGDGSVAQLKRSVDEATDEYNELMTHVGYSDDYLREQSSYSDPREGELASICNPEIRAYVQESGLILVNWSSLPTNG